MRLQLLLSSALVLSVASASAATFRAAAPVVTPATSAMNFQGVDVSPAVAYYQSSVRTVDQPFTIYNWSAAGNDPFWAEEKADGDSSLMGLAQRSSRSFWSSYGGPSDSMYGQGLYAAEDPVATMSYGGGVPSFVLMQMQIPKNFRMLDLVYNSLDTPSNSLKVAAASVLTKFECPADATADRLFQSGGMNLSPKCRELVREVFQNQLKIDGFAYSYSATAFTDCKINMDGYQQMLAFVMTSSYWMDKSSVHYYTTRSRQNLEERVRIQTLFFKEASQKYMKPSLQALVAYLDSHEDSDLKGSVTKCSGDYCSITVHFCNQQKHCDDVALDPIPRPYGSKISEFEAKLTVASGVLWADLVGMEKSATISTWLKENMYGCNGRDPYVKPNLKGGK